MPLFAAAVAPPVAETLSCENECTASSGVTGAQCSAAGTNRVLFFRSVGDFSNLSGSRHVHAALSE